MSSDGDDDEQGQALDEYLMWRASVDRRWISGSDGEVAQGLMEE